MRARRVLKTRGYETRKTRLPMLAAFGGRKPTNRRLKEALEMARGLKATLEVGE